MVTLTVYSDPETAPQGTIIHPSVYLLLDEYLYAVLNNKDFPSLDFIESWRPKIMGVEHELPNQGFWNDRALFDIEQPHAIRVLVCGNTGIGKSTLINRVFGVEIVRMRASGFVQASADRLEKTESSARDRGIHNVREEIVDPARPDLIVHDSGGFEAGDDSQIESIETFVREKSRVAELENRIHAVWYGSSEEIFYRVERITETEKGSASKLTVRERDKKLQSSSSRPSHSMHETYPLSLSRRSATSSTPSSSRRRGSTLKDSARNPRWTNSTSTHKRS